MAKGSNEGKSFPTGKDDMGIDQVPRARGVFKGSGEVNRSKSFKTSPDSVTGKTKNTIGENFK